MRSSQVTVRARVPIAAGVVCLLCLPGLGASPPSSPLASAPLKHTPRRVEVKIEDLKFKPADIEVGPGDTVVWTNDDETEHGIKANDGSFNSGRLASGHTYEHKFDRAGKVVYHDDLHPRMHGSVTVADK